MNHLFLILVFVLVGSIIIPAYAEYCVTSNSGTVHCFDDDYNSNNIDYSYLGADLRDDYWNQKSDLNCYGEDYRCLNLDGSSKYYNYDNSLGNGCYSDMPYLHSDGYCYSYQETIPDERVPVKDLDFLNYTYEDWCFDTYGKYLDLNGYCIPSLSSYTNYGIDKISWNIYDTKGNFYGWNIDREVYDDMIINGKKLSELNYANELYLKNNDGSIFESVRYDGFVYGAFEGTIDDVYDNSNSNSDFIYEVWYIVSQLTDYRYDRNDGFYIGDEGRYALDTLSRGSGDCEDLVILIADMLVSSKYTKDWDIQYVYLDGDNPLDSQISNHLVLYVNDGQYDYYIEATGDPKWDYYPYGINGWYFDVQTA